MASEAGDEATSVVSSVSEGAGSSTSSSSSSTSSIEALAAEEEEEEEVVVVQTEEQAPGDGDKEQQVELPEGWLLHTISRLGYNGSIYAEETGGKKGQFPSPGYAFTVRNKTTRKPKCLLCGHEGNSPFMHNMLTHLRSHVQFKKYEETLGKSGVGNGGNGESGGTVTWSTARKDRMRRLIVSMVVVHGRAFEMLRDELFQKLITELSCGEMKCPCTRTLRNEVEMLSKNVMTALRKEIKNALPGSRSLSADGWTAGYLPLTRQLDGSYKAVPMAREEGGRRSETTVQQWQGPGPEKVHHLFKRVRVVTNFHTNRPNNKLKHILHNRAVENGEVEGERVGSFLKPAETRWTGLYVMGKALYQNNDYTLKFSYDNPLATDCCLAPADYHLLGQVLAVLEPFTAAMDIFQNTDDVSISLIYPELLVIIKTLDDMEGEMEVGGKSMSVASLDPSVQALRKGLRNDLFSRFFSMQDGAAGEVYKHFITYGSAAYLDPRNIPAQSLFHTPTSDGRNLFHHMGTALLALCNKHKAGIVTFLQRELARNPTAPWVTRAGLLSGAGTARRASEGDRGGAPAADGGGDPPPAKRAKNWRNQMAADFLVGNRSAGDVGAGRVGYGSGVGGGGSGSLLMKEEMVHALLKEETEKYAVYWTAERVQIHGFPLPDMENCPLKQFWMMHRETMPVLSWASSSSSSMISSSSSETSCAALLPYWAAYTCPLRR